MASVLVVRAFQTMRMVPQEELLPVLLATLSGSIPPDAQVGVAAVKAEHRGNQNQRLFAVGILPFATPRPRDAVPYLMQNLSDASIQVRYMARFYILALAHEAPETVEMLRSLLKSSDRDDVLSGIKLVGGVGIPSELIELNFDTRAVFVLAPELIELLGSPDGRLARAAADALRGMLTDEVRAQVEAAQKSTNPKIARGAAELLAPRYAQPVPPVAAYAAPPQTYVPPPGQAPAPVAPQAAVPE
jgi:hypothetical protein